MLWLLFRSLRERERKKGKRLESSRLLKIFQVAIAYKLPLSVMEAEETVCITFI